MGGAREVHTTCPYCGVGCGVIAQVGAEATVAIRGDPSHPANHGRLCSKGAALAETLGLQGRLLYPEIHGRRVSWDTALEAVATGLQETVREHGPEAVAFYVSGQLLTEDYYVANKLMKGYIGAANIDTNSRLCMASSVAAHRRAFGADTVPGCYEDIELADLVVLVGANLAWCHPVLFQRLQQAREQRRAPQVVVIDPRRTATCDRAELHLALAPGTDAWLWNGLLHFLRSHGKVDYAFLEAHAEGYAAALAAAQASSPSVPAVATRCGLEEEDVARFYHLFARTDKVVTVYSQGLNQSSSGTDKVNAVINCHLLTGRIGRPGMGPFSVTGQPNAMGGREVGGLANQLAAHLLLEEPAHRALVQRFWGAPRMASGPGLKAVELFEAVAAGRVRAVWIMGTNPVVSMPDADRVRDALARCPLVIVSDCVRATDTMALAHIRLPALGWGEKDGTVTNSERRISRQRAFAPPPGEARADWWIVTATARRMGYAQAFAYESAADIFREHAWLSGFENQGERDFDIAALAEADYAALQPVQWPVRRGERSGAARLFGDGRFFTGSGRACLIPVYPRPPHHATAPDRPWVLNTGRVRDQWHTMTRTGNSARLMGHCDEPFAALHPGDARAVGIVDGGLVRVRGTAGAIVVRAHLSVDQRPGSIFVPMHWNDQFSARARVGALIPAVVDPVSGQPEAKHAPVSIAPVAAAWYGCVLLRRPAGHMAAPTSPRAALPQDGGRLLPFRLDSAEGSGAQVYPQGRAAGGCEDAAHRCAPLPPQASAGVCYWARIPGQHAWRFELAGSARPDSWSVWARELLGSLLPTAPGGFGTAVDAHEPGQVAGQGSEAAAPYAAVGGLPSRLEWLEYLDTAGGRYRAGCLEDGHLIAYVLIAPGPELPARSWFEGLFAERPLTSQERTGLLAGRPTAAARDGGAVVCACFNVGEIALEEAVRNGLDSVDAIGRALKAGTHCGSCIPELRRLLDAGKPASSHTPGAPGGSAPYPGGSLPVASARSPNSR